MMDRALIALALVSMAACPSDATEVAPDSGTDSEGNTSFGPFTTSTTGTSTQSTTNMTSSTSGTTDDTTTSEATSDATSMTVGGSTTGPVTSYRRPITVASGTVDADISGFVMLVTSTGEDSLRFVGEGGNVATMDGSDISFRDDAGTPLAWELVAYRPAAGRFVAWVRVPTVTAGSDTTIYMHYGDENDIVAPSNPWIDYLAVYHLEDGLNNNQNVRDSGPNGIDGVASDLDSNDAVPGMVGRGLRFQDNNDAVRLTSSILEDPGPMTVVAWARMDGSSTGFGRIYHKGANAVRRIELYMEDSGTLIWRINEGTDVNNTTCFDNPPSFMMGQFHHYVGVADNQAGQMRLYFDGGLVDSAGWNEPIDGGFDDTFIGNWDESPFGDRWFNGVIDEVHVVDGAVSDAWVAATHDNTDDPTTFSTLGPEEGLP